jgi:hypothetical protein
MSDSPKVWQPATVDTEGNAPKNRFTDSAALWSCYQQAKLEGIKNDARLTDIRANYDGFPPTLGDLSEQQFQNSNDLPNINRRELTTKTNTYRDNWNAIDKGGQHFADVRLKLEYFQTPAQHAQAEQQVTQFFNDAFFEWNPDSKSLADYVLESGSRNTQMALFGIGIAYFRDAIDWRWIMVPTRSVNVPNGTKVTLRNMSIVFVNREYTATELWECRKRDGWDEDVIVTFLALRLAENQPGVTTRLPLAEWENKVRNNELFFQRDFRQIYLVECYVQEFNEERDKNGVSKYVIADFGPNAANVEGDTVEGGFLYQKDREFACVQNVIVPFIDDPGPENDWHGVKGFADHIFDLCHFNNLFDNRLAILAILNSTPLFESETQEQRDKLSQIVISLMGVMAPGLKLSQTGVKIDLSGLSEVLEEHARLLNENSRTYPIGETMNNQEKTATQTTFDRQDQAQLTGSQVDTYRCQGLDQLFTEMFRRISAKSYPKSYPGGRAAANFMEKCANVGIPEEAIEDVQRVMASRGGGSGNSVLDVQKAQAILQVASPGQGQDEAKMAIIAALAGWDQVSTFYQRTPPTDQNDVEVTYEHGLLTLGQLIQAFGFQDHAKHLGTPDPSSPTHLGLLASSEQAAMLLLKQGLKTTLPDAIKLQRVMDATVQHSAMHVAFLGQVPVMKQLAAQMTQALKTFQNFIKSFDQQVQEAQQIQQGAQQGPSAEDQIKLDKWQVEKTILLQKAQTENQLKAQEGQQRLGQMAVEHQTKTEMAKQKFQQELGQKAVKTNVENQMSLAQSAQDAQAQALQTQQTLTSDALQHNQTVAQSDQVHQQGMAQSQQQADAVAAQTRAKHNQEEAPTSPVESGANQ